MTIYSSRKILALMYCYFYLAPAIQFYYYFNLTIVNIQKFAHVVLDGIVQQ